MTRINGEPVKLVESFDELREGMIVWVAPCKQCGVSERSILLRRYFGPTRSEPFRNITGWRWEGRRCGSAPFDVVTVHAIADRRLYRVIDEQLGADFTGERTTRELERAR